jgi:general secretion pathway protein E
LRDWKPFTAEGMSGRVMRLESGQLLYNGQGAVPSGDDHSQLDHRFAQFLVAESIIDRGGVDRAESAARKTGDRFQNVLTKLGLISEVDLTLAISKFFSVPMVMSVDVPTERIASNVIEIGYVRQNKIMPLAVEDAVLTVGVVDLFNAEPIEALKYHTGLTITLKLFSPAEFEKAFNVLYIQSQGSHDRNGVGTMEASDLDIQRLRDMASEAPVIRLVNEIIAGAVEARASDIHIEPSVDNLIVRYRIDGMLRTALRLESGLRAAVTSRVKIMSKLDIAERRMPQDGRIKISVRGVDVDFRVSTIPTVYGESVAMRILDRARVELNFNALGFSAEHINALHSLIKEPDGIILVTGPTGSGKTTTLYSALKVLNTSERKVFSVEDPIEYQLAGVNQVQVQSEIGLDFPHSLRAILRQDPDIIMIGEIRDLETARIAIQSSLTGHLVLSTLHTNSASAAITRLIDIGVENYLLASTVKGVVAQRLVRTLCKHCSKPHDSNGYWSSEIARIVPDIESSGPPAIRAARGCVECAHTGFIGRACIAEILLIDDRIQGLILSKAPDDRINAVAKEGGMISMYETGAARVWRGETAIEEVLRATRI